VGVSTYDQLKATIAMQAIPVVDLRGAHAVIVHDPDSTDLIVYADVPGSSVGVAIQLDDAAVRYLWSGAPAIDR